LAEGKGGVDAAEQLLQLESSTLYLPQYVATTTFRKGIIAKILNAEFLVTKSS
jgi:hypothetical protein